MMILPAVTIILVFEPLMALKCRWVGAGATELDEFDFPIHPDVLGACMVRSDGLKMLAIDVFRGPELGNKTVCIPRHSRFECYCATDLCNDRMPANPQALVPREYRKCEHGYIRTGDRENACYTHGSCVVVNSDPNSDHCLQPRCFKTVGFTPRYHNLDMYRQCQTVRMVKEHMLTSGLFEDVRLCFFPGQVVPYDPIANV